VLGGWKICGKLVEAGRAGTVGETGSGVAGASNGRQVGGPPKGAGTPNLPPGASSETSPIPRRPEATLARLGDEEVPRAQILESTADDAASVRRSADAARASILAAATEEAEALADEAWVLKARILEASRVEAEAHVHSARAEAGRIIAEARRRAEAISQEADRLRDRARAEAVAIVERARGEAEALARRAGEELDRATRGRAEEEAGCRRMLEEAAQTAHGLRAAAETEAAAIIERAHLAGKAQVERAQATAKATTERLLDEANVRADTIVDAARAEAEAERVLGRQRADAEAAGWLDDVHRRCREVDAALDARVRAHIDQALTEASTIRQQAEAKAEVIVGEALCAAQRLHTAADKARAELVEEPRAHGREAMGVGHSQLSADTSVVIPEVPLEERAEAPPTKSALREPWDRTHQHKAARPPVAAAPPTEPRGASGSGREVFDLLFVCSANVCRSPAAEAHLQARLAGLGIPARVASAGLGATRRPLNANALKALARKGMELRSHHPARVTRDLLIGADVVLGMASEHVGSVVRVEPSVWPKAFTLKEVVRRGEEVGPRRHDESLPAWLSRVHAGRTTNDIRAFSPRDDITDPGGQPTSAFEAMADEIRDWVDRLIFLLWPGRVGLTSVVVGDGGEKF
jgi:protein-tyrosine-phosphatase